MEDGSIGAAARQLAAIKGQACKASTAAGILGGLHMRDGCDYICCTKCASSHCRRRHVQAKRTAGARRLPPPPSLQGACLSTPGHAGGPTHNICVYSSMPNAVCWPHRPSNVHTGLQRKRRGVRPATPLMTCQNTPRHAGVSARPWQKKQGLAVFLGISWNFLDGAGMQAAPAVYSLFALGPTSCNPGLVASRHPSKQH